MSNVYLEHFGVKGMRWGVRKKQEPVSTGVAKTPMSSDAAVNFLMHVTNRQLILRYIILKDI